MVSKRREKRKTSKTQINSSLYMLSKRKKNLPNRIQLAANQRKNTACCNFSHSTERMELSGAWCDGIVLQLGEHRK